VLNRIATGVAGLDMVLGGGLERGASAVLAGAPGTGKTVLAEQICFSVATRKHRAAYYTTVSEPHTRLVGHLESFAFFDAQALGSRVEHIHLGSFFQPGRSGGLEAVLAEVTRKVLDEEPAIVVIDSAKMLRDFASEFGLRAALYDLSSKIAHTDTVLLLVGEYTAEELAGSVEFSMADAIVQLAYELREPVGRRSLRVVKTRGAASVADRQTFRIGPEGIRIFPRIETLTMPSTARPAARVRSGIPGLDEVMAGGMRQGDSALVMGPSGVGKTTFAVQWLTHALRNGEDGLFVTLQDSPDHLTEMASVFGWDIAAALASGQLDISYIPAGDLDMDVMADTVRASLATRPVRRVVVDSLGELILATREWDRFPAYLRSLIRMVQGAGSSLLLTNETSASQAGTESVDRLMFLFDNVIDLRYVERAAELGRALNVDKMRNGAQQMTMRAYTITSDGIAVGDVIEGVSGLLNWYSLRAPDGPA